jgi:hypothetical protein
MNQKQLLIVILVIVCITAGILIYRSFNTTENFSVWKDKYCKLERLEYQEIEDTSRITNNGNVESGVRANGKFIATDKINLDTIKAYLNAGQKVFVDQTTRRVVKVSQEYWEQYNSQRARLCDIVGGIENHAIESTEGKREAEHLYLDLVSFFAGIPKTGNADSITAAIGRMTKELSKRTSFIKAMFKRPLYLEDIRSLEAAFLGNIDYLLGWEVSNTNYFVYEEYKRKNCDELINTLNDLQRNTLNRKIDGHREAFTLFEKLKSESTSKNKTRADHNSVELSEQDKSDFETKILPNMIN